MACIVYRENKDGWTCIDQIFAEHDPHEVELDIAKWGREGEGIVARVCKRCDQLYWPSGVITVKAQDCTTGGSAVDKDPEKMGGSPCVAGTRVPVGVLLYFLARGYTLNSIVGEYPDLSVGQIKDALIWTAEAIEGFPDQPPRKPTAEEFSKFNDARWPDGCGYEDNPVVTWLLHQAEAE